MNRDTLCVVMGYAGDVHQIQTFLPLYQHHQCPLLILSPDNAKIGYESFPGVGGLTCWSAGQQAYIGPESLVRQKKHLELCLKWPQEYFLLNDSDSFCLSAQIPSYVYTDRVFWSNVVSDEMHPRSIEEYPNGYPYPRQAFQPPYFLHRSLLERLVSVADMVPADPRTPFIDWCLMAWAVKAGVPYRGFPHGCSCPTREYTPGQSLMCDMVKDHGAVFLHSIKEGFTMKKLLAARKEHLRSYR